MLVAAASRYLLEYLLHWRSGPDQVALLDRGVYEPFSFRAAPPMALLGTPWISDETRRLSGCLVPHNEAAHRACGQTECFRGGIDQGSRRAVAVHRIADDSFALLCCVDVDCIDRA
jgi:hypothetical protein